MKPSPFPNRQWVADLKSGFMVSLIALPLCLGIASASGCPPIAGIYTAIAGGIIASFLSNSQLTIKGPAAGLIVIVLGCVTECSDFAKHSGVSEGDLAFTAYRMMLAVAVVSGIIQILFGLIKGGVLGDFFPSSAVHGLLASIGIIIMAKQIPVAFGVPKEYLFNAHGHAYEPLDLILHLPQALWHFNPYISVIGIVGLALMFGLPALFPKIVKLIPSQLVVLAVTIPLAFMVLQMPLPGNPDRVYQFAGNEYALMASKHLVSVPTDAVNQLSSRAISMTQGTLFPDFSFLKTWVAWKWVALFAIIGSLESLLSAKAVDMLDPQKRKSDLNRDLFAVGVANTMIAFLGGIPMIAEIVRSRANIDNGARSSLSNMFHGAFLLSAVWLIPSLLNLIPLAALATMLIFTGSRLAHPREFMHVYHQGREQLVVFVVTIIGVLATDLLVGILIGIGVKILIHFIHGMPLSSLFYPFLTIEELDEKTYLIKAARSAVFSNWLMLRRQIYSYGILVDKNVIVDLTDTELVDHSTMEKLHELERDFTAKGLSLTITGLDEHTPLSNHPEATRIKRNVPAASAPH